MRVCDKNNCGERAVESFAAELEGTVIDLCQKHKDAFIKFVCEPDKKRRMGRKKSSAKAG